MKNFVTVFFDRALENGHKLIFHNFCHFEAISFGTNFLRLLSFSMVWITVRQLQDCRILFSYPYQPMGCFSKRCRESRFSLKTFVQMKMMCCQWKKIKVEIIANCLLRFGYTHRLHTFFKSFSASKTWKTSLFQPLGSFLLSILMQPLW